jgi:hypothetical protein
MLRSVVVISTLRVRLGVQAIVRPKHTGGRHCGGCKRMLVTYMQCGHSHHRWTSGRRRWGRRRLVRLIRHHRATRSYSWRSQNLFRFLVRSEQGHIALALGRETMARKSLTYVFRIVLEMAVVLAITTWAAFPPRPGNHLRRFPRGIRGTERYFN